MFESSAYATHYLTICKTIKLSKMDYCLYILDRISLILDVADIRFRKINDEIHHILATSPGIKGAKKICSMCTESYVFPEGDYPPSPALEFYVGSYFETAAYFAKFLEKPSDDTFLDFCEVSQTMINAAYHNFGHTITDLDDREIIDHFINGTNKNQAYKRFVKAVVSRKIKY